MTMDREKEREAELESAMYTNCLLLGLDPSIVGVGANNGTPRVGLFRHTNRKLGEHFLYFILSTLRGPKEFDKVWPIYDPTQTRDFRKVVQSIINDLESQGAIPKSNSTVSSLATCCGVRFVELLWQLSLHALREVHKRTLHTADHEVSNPLTDVAFSHAATLLPVTKARIALERRKFLKNAETAVHRQSMWSNLAHEMTSEYRSLCAEEAYLQQELEKLHDLRNKVKMEGEPWDEIVSTSSQNSQLVQKATRLWDSLLSCKSQHEVLASGPIEDLIAHREHRYRISGSSIIEAMNDKSIEVKVNKENVDIAEVLRRWTHALQRIHKHSLHLVKANNGEGPDLLRSAYGGGTGGHAESLATTLAEHRQHLASIQVLVNQLKGVAPTIQNSISQLSQEVNTISVQPQSTRRKTESSSDDVTDISSRLLTVQIDNKVSSSKLPPLFNLPQNSTAKNENFHKRHTNVSENIPLEQTDNENDYIGNLKRSVREAVLATRFCHVGPEKKETLSASKQFLASEVNTSLSDFDAINSNYAESEGRLSFYDVEETHDHGFSPPFLMEADSFEDLLGKNNI